MENIIFRHSYDNLAEAVRNVNLAGRKFCIISDSNVASLYMENVKKALGDMPSFVFKAGETQKHLGTIEEMYKFFLTHTLDRQSVVFALGGGVVGDMAGFAAATYMRGISVIQLPTTLLAQVDAGLGGKTGVDFAGVKNLIGAFHQPSLVYTNLSTLNTLPQSEFFSGMAEVIKHGLIADMEYYQYLINNQEAIKNLDPLVMEDVVIGSCKIKSQVVAKDEKEAGLREILNFGHCVGHAIESLSEYSIPHGKCVAIGMCAALRLSQICNEGKTPISPDDYKKAVDLMKFFELPVKIEGYSLSDILANMYKDKKTRSGNLRIVLLKKIGEAYTDNTLSREKILECLAEV